MTQSSLSGKSQDLSQMLLFMSFFVVQDRLFQNLFGILVLLKITDMYINNTVHNFYLLSNFPVPLQQVRLSSWPKEKPGSWFSEFKRGKLVCYYPNMKWFILNFINEAQIMYYTLPGKV